MVDPKSCYELYIPRTEFPLFMDYVDSIGLFLQRAGIVSRKSGLSKRERVAEVLAYAYRVRGVSLLPMQGSSDASVSEDVRMIQHAIDRMHLFYPKKDGVSYTSDPFVTVLPIPISPIYPKVVLEFVAAIVARENLIAHPPRTQELWRLDFLAANYVLEYLLSWNGRLPDNTLGEDWILRDHR